MSRESATTRRSTEGSAQAGSDGGAVGVDAGADREADQHDPGVAKVRQRLALHRLDGEPSGHLKVLEDAGLAGRTRNDDRSVTIAASTEGVKALALFVVGMHTKLGAQSNRPTDPGAPSPTDQPVADASPVGMGYSGTMKNGPGGSTSQS